MKVVTRNRFAENPAFFSQVKTHTYYGELVATPKWVEYPAIAMTTDNPKFIRVLAKDIIVSVDDEAFKAEKVNPNKREFKVTGSKGDTYTVTVEGNHKSCTCQAFMFRRNCKHIVSVQ